MRRKEPRRSHVEISAEILRIARRGAIRTRIVYGANLNFHILRKYVKNLCREGLVEFDGELVKTTEKGERYLERYYSLKQIGGSLVV